MPNTLGENIEVREVRARARSFDETAQSWEPLRDMPRSLAEFAARVVRDSSTLYDDVETIYTEAYESYIKDASMDPATLQAERHAFGEALRLSARGTYGWWEHFDQIAKETGRPIGGIERLLEVAEKFKQLQIRLADEWPVCSTEETAEVQTQFERGEGMALEDAFAKIAGVDKAGWLERVEEHKRKRRQGGQE